MSTTKANKKGIEQMNNLLILFILLSVVNVILQTVKSLCTVKCGKFVAAIVNAITFGVYTVVIVYTNCELDLWVKVAVTALVNLVGVYIVKWIEEKLRKDKLWKIEFTVKQDEDIDTILDVLSASEIPHNYIDVETHFIVNTYCATQADSTIVHSIIKKYNAKYFASETKLL